MPRQVSLSPDHQSLRLSNPSGTEVTIPLSTVGLSLLRSLLIEDKRAEVRRAMENRASAVRDSNRLLADAMALGVGSPASPVQDDIDKWLDGVGPHPTVTVLAPRSRAIRPHATSDFDLEEIGL